MSIMLVPSRSLGSRFRQTELSHQFEHDRQHPPRGCKQPRHHDERRWKVSVQSSFRRRRHRCIHDQLGWHTQPTRRYRRSPQNSRLQRYRCPLVAIQGSSPVLQAAWHGASSIVMRSWRLHSAVQVMVNCAFNDNQHKCEDGENELKPLGPELLGSRRLNSPLR